MGRYYEVFTTCSLYDIDEIGHADHSAAFFQQRGALQFEVFASSQRLVDRISLQHEGQFGTQIKTDYVVVLTGAGFTSYSTQRA